MLSEAEIPIPGFMKASDSCKILVFDRFISQRIQSIRFWADKIWKSKMSKLSSKPLYKHPHLAVATSKYGHGVFATKNIPADTTLEECHHLRIRAEDCSGIIDDYVYSLASENEGSETESEYYSLPLGWGSIFNHADDHNTEYWHDTDRDLIVFHTIKDVSAGEQLFINYGQEWWETRELIPDNGE